MRRCFVFPPHLSSASVLPCEIGNPEDSALVHYACNTGATLLTAFFLNHALQQPRDGRIDYKIQAVMQQRQYKS